MALMQIAEPGQSPDPHKKHLVLGIDLGTTHSLVAAVKNGRAQCLQDDQGRNLLDSQVIYSAQHIIVGANSEIQTDSSVVIGSIKRFLGRSAAEVQTLLEQFPVTYTWDFTDSGMPKVQTPQGLKTPIEISAQILKALKQRAIAHFGVDQFNEQHENAFQAVITVPAYFDNAQRQATHDAAALAGIKVLRLINEPTAAALAYGVQDDGDYLVYDLGGGTFDVSLIAKNADVYEVLGTAGNTFLGGDDIDEALLQWYIARYPHSTAPTRQQVRFIKEKLSYDQNQNFNGNQITQVDLMEVMQPFIVQTQLCVQQVFRNADFKPQQLKDVLLVGGSTKSPIIKANLTQFLGLKPRDEVNPDEVVALGALAQARKMTSKDAKHLLLDVCPLSLGLETMGGIVEKIIPRNTPIPVTESQTFTTMKNNQSALHLHIVQGERETVETCRSLARFELRDLPALPAGVPRIQVQFAMDADGLLKVSAQELSTGKTTAVEVKPSQGLSEQGLLQLLKDAQTHGKADVKKRMITTARVELERIIEACEYALAEDSALLIASEMTDFNTALNNAKKVLTNTHADTEEFNTAREQLNKASELLASRRMDKAVQDALQGTYIN